MAEPKKVHVGEVLPPRALSAFDGFTALAQMVDAVQDCVKVHAVESTKQAQFAAYEATEVARIKAAESVLKNYFEQAFAERRANFEGLFERLDTALDRGDQQAVSTVLTGIVEIARTSPLAAMGDLGQIRAAIDDPDHVWEF